MVEVDCSVGIGRDAKVGREVIVRWLAWLAADQRNILNSVSRSFDVKEVNYHTMS